MPAKKGNTNGARRDRVPYYDRLDPVAEFEYEGQGDAGNNGDRVVGEVVVYDDSSANDVVHVQVRQPLRRGQKVAVLHLSPDGLRELVDDLSGAADTIGV